MLLRSGMSEVERLAPPVTSLLRCPHCGYAAEVALPDNACVIMQECDGCDVVIRPKAGDCCVFCSYGSAPCPPVQASQLARSGDK